MTQRTVCTAPCISMIIIHTMQSVILYVILYNVCISNANTSYFFYILGLYEEIKPTLPVTILPQKHQIISVFTDLITFNSRKKATVSLFKFLTYAKSVNECVYLRLLKNKGHIIADAVAAVVLTFSVQIW